MGIALKKDMEKIFSDTEQVKQRIEELEKEDFEWNRYNDHDDLLKIMEKIKELEVDVSLLMSDCANNNNWNIKNDMMGDLNQAFKGLNTLFQDFKMVRERIDHYYSMQGELQRLEIDWARFRKTVKKVQSDLRRSRSEAERTICK
jgi:hypothetical protein